MQRDETKHELWRRLREINGAAEGSFDVAVLEPLLVDLLGWLSTGRVDRLAAAEVFIEQSESWPLGSVEATEFTMRRLQWNEVRDALRQQLDTDADFRIKDQSRRMLEAYEPRWPAGEIYAHYR